MWAKILNACKWIAGVVGGVTAIVTIVLVIYSQGIKSEQKRSKDYTFESKVDRLITSDSTKTKMLGTIINDVRELKTGQENQVLEQKVMKKIIIEQFSKTMTKDELLEMFNAFEEKSLKKNGISSLTIPYKQDITSLRYLYEK